MEIESVTQWTVDTLKEYVDKIMDERDKYMRSALDRADKATEKEERNSLLWRQSANEWREAMNDRESKFANVTELHEIKARMDRQEGSGVGMRSLWGIITGAIVVIGIVINVFIALR